MTPRTQTSTSRQKSAGEPPNYATRMAKALGHPLRTAIMVELNQRTASPVALARDLNESVGNVSYHVRVLLELDCIELVETRPRRGALEHFYRATTRAELDDEAWAQLPAAARTAGAQQWFRTVFADISKAIDADRFATEDVHFSYTHLELDDEGWAELAQRAVELIDRGLELHAAAAPTDGPRRKGMLVMSLFESAPKRS